MPGIGDWCDLESSLYLMYFMYTGIVITFTEWRRLFSYLMVYLPLLMYVCLPACLSVCLSVYLSEDRIIPGAVNHDLAK